MRLRIDLRRVALLVALYALTFLVAIPPGVCFCELEGGSCCGPALDLGPADGEGRSTEAAPPPPERPCCDGCAVAAAAAAASSGARADRGTAGSPEGVHGIDP